MGDSIQSRVQDLVAEQLGLDRSDLVSGANILDDLGADSLDVVELVMAIEETFGLEVPDEEIEALRTIGDVEKFVASRLAA
ncbi:MAG: acyl carrier protein [Proteobacteria bacterium]|nr:acyl carrier protein [Pseudomonadota bacterium]